MATAKEIRSAASQAVEWATQNEPGDAGFRARMFVAYLEGLLQDSDPELSGELKRLRQYDGTTGAQSAKGA